MEDNGNENICVICQTEIDKTKSDDNVFIKCLHCFHKECWDMYRLHHQQSIALSCPVCKTVLEEHISITIQPIHTLRPHRSSNAEVHIPISSFDKGCWCFSKKTLLQCLIILFVVLVVALSMVVWQQQNK